MWEKKTPSLIPSLQAGLLIEKLPVLISTNMEKAFSEIPYSILISPACDIESCLKIQSNSNGALEYGRQVIFQLLFCPAFDEELFKTGDHFKDIYDCKTKILEKKEFDKIKSDTTRYFHIVKENGVQLPNLTVDYKHYFTLPVQLVQEHIKDVKNYHVLQHIQYTRLADQFAHYIQRVSIP